MKRIFNFLKHLFVCICLALGFLSYAEIAHYSVDKTNLTAHNTHAEFNTTDPTLVKGITSLTKRRCETFQYKYVIKNPDNSPITVDFEDTLPENIGVAFDLNAIMVTDSNTSTTYTASDLDITGSTATLFKLNNLAISGQNTVSIYIDVTVSNTAVYGDVSRSAMIRYENTGPAIYSDNPNTVKKPTLTDLDPTTFTIKEVSAGEIFALDGVNTFCTTDDIALITNGDLGGQWQSSNPLVANIQSNISPLVIIEINQPGTTEISYTVNGVNGCPSSTSTFNIVVAEIPVTSSISDSGSNGKICLKDNSIGTYSVDTTDGPNGTPGSNYTWNVQEANFTGTITKTSENEVEIDWSGTSPGTYTIEVTENNGNCNGEVKQLPIEVYPPSISIEVDAYPFVCLGQDAVFTVRSEPYAIVHYKTSTLTATSGSTRTFNLGPNGEGSINFSNPSSDVTFTIEKIVTDNGNGCTYYPDASNTSHTSEVGRLFAEVTALDEEICNGKTGVFEISGIPNAKITYRFNQDTVQQVTLGDDGKVEISKTLTETTRLLIIAVETPGCSGTTFIADDTITVLELPDPDVMLIPYGNAKICPNEDAVFQIIGDSDATISYTINNGNEQTVILNNFGEASITKAGATTNTTLTITGITSKDGCFSAVNSVSKTIEIQPLPQTPLLSVDKSIVCETDNVSFTITNPDSAAVEITYTLNGNEASLPLAASSSKIINIINLQANTTLQLTHITNTSTSCEKPLNIMDTVIVNPLPQEPVITIDTPEICTGEDAIFNISGGDAGATLQYTINNGSTETATLNNQGKATITIDSVTSDTTLRITEATSTNQCTTSISNLSSTILIKPLPIAPNISYNTAVCYGEDAVFNITDGDPGAVINYTINNGNTQSITLDNQGEGTITEVGITSNTVLKIIDITSINQCAIAIDDFSITAEMNPLPKAPVITNNSKICYGGTAAFEITEGDPGAVVDYTVNGGTEQSITLDASGEATITQANVISNTVLSITKITGTNGCDTSNNLVSIVEVYPLSQIPVITSNSNICYGNDAIFEITGGDAGATVNFTINNGPKQSITLNNQGNATFTQATVTANTILVITDITSTTQCNTTVNSLSSSVEINPLPQANVTSVSTSTPEICSGEDAIFNISGIPITDVYYTINNGTTQSITLNTSGQATVTETDITTNTTFTITGITNNNGCTITENQNAIVSVRPSPTASITSNTPMICANEDAIFNISGTANSEISYTVNNGGSTETITLDASGNAIITVENTNTDVTLAITDITTSNGCELLIAIEETIQIYAAPNTFFVANDAVCSGEDAVFTISGDANSFITYTLDNGTETTEALGSSGELSIVVDTVFNDVTLRITKITTSDGCELASNIERTLTVNPVPNSIDIINPDIICMGEDAIFEIYGDPNSRIFYTINNDKATKVLNSQGYTSISVATPTSDTSLKINKIETEAGCEVDMIGIEKAVVVSQLPTTPTIVVDNDFVCPGGNAVFNISGDPNTTIAYVINNGDVWYEELNNQGQVTIGIDDINEDTTLEVKTITNTDGCSTFSTVNNVVLVIPVMTETVYEEQTLCMYETKEYTIDKNEALGLGKPDSVYSWEVIESAFEGDITLITDSGDNIAIAWGNTPPGTYTISVHEQSDFCEATPLVVYVTIEQPYSELLPEYWICDSNLGITLDAGFDETFSYTWSVPEGAKTPEKTSSIVAKVAGNYTVEVATPSGCSEVYSTTVYQATPIVINSIAIENKTVTIDASGGSKRLMFAIDGGSYRDINIFSGLEGGTHIIDIKDVNDCFSRSVEICIPLTPKFFTPNGDGVHDNWQISDCEDLNPTEVMIFDRYGKIVAQMYTNSIGWDGTSNGIQLPNTDYWYAFERGNDVFRGHFALKR